LKDFNYHYPELPKGAFVITVYKWEPYKNMGLYHFSFPTLARQCHRRDLLRHNFYQRTNYV